MTNKALIRRLQISCLGLDPIDPLRLLVDDVIEALTQPELCKYGQEPKSCTSNPMDCQCAIDAALAQPEQDHIPDARKMVTEQEPVAYWKEHAQGLQRDYDSLLADFQAQRSESSGKPSAWVELTNGELTDLFYNTNLGQQSAVAQAIALLKEKNT